MRIFRVGLAVVLLLGLVALPACGPAGEGASGPRSRPNILLISLDTLRADHVGCYGSDRFTSPFLDALARRGTSFPHSFINTLGTTPSHATMLSSLYQETHKVEYHHLEGESAFDVIPRRVALLPEILRQAGYITLGVSGGGRMSRKFGFDRGFLDYTERATMDLQQQRMVNLVNHHREDGRPIFAFFHTYEVHGPYEPPPHHRVHFGPTEGQYEGTIANLRKFKTTAKRDLAAPDLEHFITLYDAGIRYTDEMVKGFFARLGAMGFLDNCLVVITADHGEEFAEHGGLLHRALLFEELLNVPLIVLGPGVPAGVVDRRMAEAVDVTRTILTYAGIEPRPEMEGYDLLAPAPPERGGPDAAIVAQAGNIRYTLRTRDWKLIHDIPKNRVRLFHLVPDPSERRNLVKQKEHRRDAMLRSLELWKSERLVLPDERNQAEMTRDEMRMLEELGYVYDTPGE